MMCHSTESKLTQLLVLLEQVSDKLLNIFKAFFLSEFQFDNVESFRLAKLIFELD